SIPVEGEAPHRRLRQIAADAIGQNRDFRANVDARLESRLPLSLFADSAIPGANTDDAIALVEDLDGGETSKHVDTSGLDEAAEPFDESTERDDVIAVILKRWRRDRKPQSTGSGEEIHAVVVNFRRERRSLRGEVRHQPMKCGRIEHRTGEHVRANLARLFEHGDGKRLPTLFL